MPPAVSRSTITLLSILWISAAARADCECGYSANVDGTSEPAVFTDLLESDFTAAVDGSRSWNGDWLAVEFNVTQQRSRGRFGQSFDASNVAGPVWAGDGLRLIVRSEPRDGLIIGAELNSLRADLLYGTYRTAIKATDIPGTCSAFFWVCRLYEHHMNTAAELLVTKTLTVLQRHPGDRH